MIKIALPIGISFCTFQMMSYVFDVYYGRVRAQHSLAKLALYIMMFPQLIAGPIVRYNAIAAEISDRRETFRGFSEGITRFIIGLSKKVLVADFLGAIADSVFTLAATQDIPVFTAWIGAICYTLQIYYDFSGYSDMAIGLGRCFGFHFEENFNYPYIAKSITEFWRRWHISLTAWFRDYVYIPLGGNRVSAGRHVRNLFIVWMLTGIWHGAEWTFLLWGFVYFVFQIMEKRLGYTEKIPGWCGHVYTMIIVILCWVIFRAENMSQAFHYLRNMFTDTGGLYDEQSLVYFASATRVTVLAVIGCIPVLPLFKTFLCDAGKKRASHINY